MTIWRQEDVNPDDPEERFLAVLQFVPMVGQSPMGFPEYMARQISKHLTECGVPPVDMALATKKLIRPYRGQQHALNGLGQWVPLDVEEPDPIVIQDPAAMTSHEREAQVERLRYLGYKVNEPEAQAPAAQDVDALDDPPQFDPGPRTVTEVNTYLRGLDDPVERGRVLYAERNGAARAGILKRHKEFT
jgi:hypothetical protein